MRVQVTQDMTQKEIVLRHLKENPNGLTPMQAFSYYGITRLAAKVFELKKDGVVIKTTDVKKKVGKRICVYAKYTLEERRTA